MPGLSTDHNDPNVRAFYQSLADVTAIFWQFHKARVANRAVPQVLYDTSETLEFDAQAEAETSNKILDKFEKSMASTIRNSWEKFLILNGSDAIHDDPLLRARIEQGEIPDWMKLFSDEYIVRLLREVDARFRQRSVDKAGISIDSIEGYAFDNTMHSGINTGAGVGVAVKSIFGPDFNPFQLMWVSKIKVYNLGGLSRDLGVQSYTDIREHIPRRPIHQRYTLLDDSKLGFDKTKLKDMGLGTALGCVASITPTSATKDFILRKVPDYDGRPMMIDFARYVDSAFEHYIGDWYKELSPEQLEALDPEFRRIMDGDARQDALERNLLRATADLSEANPHASSKEAF